MALEIQEIGIRLRVDENGSPSTEGQGDKTNAAQEECGCGENDREGIVEECVRRVLLTLDAFGRR